jgi:hypothetical protein
MSARALVVRPGQGHRVGNVEFLARTADTPRFTFGITEIAARRQLDEHVHADEDDAFYIMEGEMTFTLGGEEVAAPPGTFVLVPPGVVHGRKVRYLGDHPGRASTGDASFLHRPARDVQSARLASLRRASGEAPGQHRALAVWRPSESAGSN